MQEVEGLAFDLTGGVATITLNRPEKLNAIRWAMVNGIIDWVTALGEDPGRAGHRDHRRRAGVLIGRRHRGRDGRRGLPDPAARVARAVTRGPHYRMIKTLMSMPKPVVAALNGRTHGAGWVIALACDFRVSRDDALIGDIRSGKAIFANQGVGLMLPHLIGASRAMDLLMTGRVIEAAEAERFGILQRLWPAADWDRELDAFIQELAAGPTRSTRPGRPA